jgi:heptosyltransferase-1
VPLAEEILIAEIEGSAKIERMSVELPLIDRLLIVRLSAMGDVIHTLPAAQALRDAFPNSMIGWVIEERWAELLCAPGTPRRGPRSVQRPLVDWVHPVTLTRWRKSLFTIPTLQEIAKTWNDVRGAHYDVAVDLQGAIRSAVLASWSGARVVYGAAEPRESPASLGYTRRAITHGAHVIEQNLSIAKAVAQKKMKMPCVEFPRDVAAERRIGQQLAERRIGEFVILNPGAGWGAKRWPAERFGRVARALAEDGVHAIVNYGPGEESLANEAADASEGAAKPMKCSLSELIALTRRARLFIGGDTGPMHLAAALQVPVVAIFGPTDPVRNGPYPVSNPKSDGARSIVLRNPASSTTHARRSQPDGGLLEISVDEVVRAARKLLARGQVGGQECPPHNEGAHG